MNRPHPLAIALLATALALGAAASEAALLQAQGKVTFLRAHDVGTAFGPPSDRIDVEVVFQLDGDASRSYGFQVRNDAQRAARQGMLDLLRDAFNHGWTVVTDFEIADPATRRNGVVIRVALTNNREPTAFQYAAKFVCGRADAKVLPLGTYYTAINVHNPGTRAAAIRKRFAIALPGEKAGPVSRDFDARLAPGQAFEIDCPDILNHVAPANFLKGFVTLESRESLEVVGVYAAARSDDGEVVSEEIERVPARLIPLRLPDLLPVPGPNGSFCRLSGSQLLVTVINQGQVGTSQTTTEVDFLQGTKLTLPTQPLAPGASATITFFPIPPGHFQPEGTHPFLIRADLLNQEQESNEANNLVNAQCVVIN